MSLYKNFKTSSVLEEEGIFVKLKANEDGTIPTFKIARASRNNKRYVKTFEAKIRPFKDEIESGNLDPETDKRIMVDIFVSGVLLDWKNVQDENNKPMLFNRDNAIKLLTDLPELYEFLNNKASDMKNFLEANLKGDEKN